MLEGWLVNSRGASSLGKHAGHYCFIITLLLLPFLFPLLLFLFSLFLLLLLLFFGGAGRLASHVSQASLNSLCS